MAMQKQKSDRYPPPPTAKRSARTDSCRATVEASFVKRTLWIVLAVALALAAAGFLAWQILGPPDPAEVLRQVILDVGATADRIHARFARRVH